MQRLMLIYNRMSFTQQAGWRSLSPRASQQQKIVAMSIFDAEYIAGTKAVKEAVWIWNFINDLQIPSLLLSLFLFISIVIQHLGLRL